jgi:Zn-dependent protease with chaperone function
MSQGVWRRFRPALKTHAARNARICAAFLAFVCAGALPASFPPQLAYEPVALAWTAREVEQAGARGWEAIRKQTAHDGQPDCRSACERAQPIFRELLKVARIQTPRARQLAWSLTVVRDPAISAMSFPGGQIVVSEAFMTTQPMSDEALAFVLAHEMAHCVLEHERQALTFARMLLPREIPRSVADVYTEIDFNFGLLESMEPVLQQGEFEADELGLLMASAAGFAPARQLEFMEHEAQRAGAETAVVNTHPPARQRLQLLRERMPLAERLYWASPARSN